MVRLETGCAKLDWEVIKSTLHYWIKIMKMKENRLPRLAYENMRNTYLTNPSIPANSSWYTRLIEMLQKVDHVYLLEQESPEAILQALPTIEGRTRKIAFEEDIKRALGSTYNQTFKEIKDLETLHVEPYLTLALPLSYIRVFANCRLAGRYSLKFYLNKIQYKINPSENCQVSNCNALEKIEHIIFECPMYTNLRTKYLDDAGRMDLFKSYDSDKIRNLFFYIRDVIKLRAFILNEYYTD
ncbi:hypothetical protein QAD02_001818 [Eretmocerus hayati]|uniref:Uncharacterized protein n=1 Tax=Eretmocerus hayati TaxID=131215 RepID=A0ACC2NHG4_9HYME|nr:hypothetical protein QAD02_001818 [Eretmocerus hayati]